MFKRKDDPLLCNCLFKLGLFDLINKASLTLISLSEEPLDKIFVLRSVLSIKSQPRFRYTAFMVGTFK